MFTEGFPDPGTVRSGPGMFRIECFVFIFLEKYDFEKKYEKVIIMVHKLAGVLENQYGWVKKLEIMQNGGKF